MQSELEALRRDLARFERGTRVMWLAGLAAAVVLAVLWGAARQAQSQPTALSVRQLVLVDQNNHQRIVLAADTNNRPGIWIDDSAGKTRLRFGLGTQPASPLLFLADETGRPRLALGSNVEHNDPQLTMVDGSGITRAYFGFGVQLRTPQMVFDDDRGKDRLYAGWTPAGAPIIAVNDESGATIWRSTGGPGGTPAGGSGAGGGGPQRKNAAP